MPSQLNGRLQLAAENMGGGGLHLLQASVAELLFQVVSGPHVAFGFYIMDVNEGLSQRGSMKTV